MTDSEVISLIQKALAEVAPKRAAEFSNINLETTIESLGLDSIATMEMVGSLEDQVNATFPDEDLTEVSTLGDLAKLIRSNS